MLFVTVVFLPMSFGQHFALSSPIQKASVYFLIYSSLLYKVERENSSPVDFGGLSTSLLWNTEP